MILLIGTQKWLYVRFGMRYHMGKALINVIAMLTMVETSHLGSLAYVHGLLQEKGLGDSQ